MSNDHRDPPAAAVAAFPVLAGTTGIHPAEPGHATRAWRITTSTGSFLLRRFSPDITADQAAATLRVHSRAADAGLAPTLLPAGTGRPITRAAGRLFALTTHLQAKAFDPDKADACSCHRLGRLLGRLHHRLRETPADGLPGWRLPATSALRAALAAHNSSGCAHPAARRVLRAKLARAHAIPSRVLAHLNGLDRQVIHGDVHPGNILLTGTGPVLVDFDLARSAPPAYELMRALIYCTHPVGSPEAHRDRVSAFLHGYLTARPLTHEEIDAMVAVYQVVQIFDPYGLHTCQDAAPALVAFGHARFALLYWLARHGATLTTMAHHIRRRIGQRR